MSYLRIVLYHPYIRATSTIHEMQVLEEIDDDDDDDDDDEMIRYGELVICSCILSLVIRFFIINSCVLYAIKHN